MYNRKKICTSLKQSQHLKEMGVDPSTSDMTWLRSQWTPECAYGENGYCLFAFPGATTSQDPVGTPAWSASALIALLPESIPDKHNKEKDCVLFIGKDANGNFIASYDNEDESHKPTFFQGADLVDVVFKLYTKVTGIFRDDDDDE